MKNEVGIAVIGCGAISDYHINALRLIPQAKIRVFCDIDLSRACAKAQGHADVCSDWHETLSRDDVDLAMILTPNDLHCEMAVEAAKAGKNVFVQKPMARSSQECRLMIETAQKCGVMLFQSYMHRYFEESRYAREYIKSGRLGDVYLCRIRNSLPGSDYSSWQYDHVRCGRGGAIIDVGVHGIDLVSYILGDIEEVVSASKGQHVHERMINGECVHPDNEDWALATYRLSSGAFVSHEISWIQKWQCNRFVMEMHGSKGSIFLRTGFGPLAYTSIDSAQPGELIKPVLADVPFGYRQHEEVIQCILQGKPPVCSGHDGLRALSVVEKILDKASM